MRRQRAVAGLPVERPHRRQATGLILIQEPLHSGPRHVRQFANHRMALAMGLEPEDFHSALHQRVGMMKSIPLDLGQHILRDSKWRILAVLADGRREKPPSRRLDFSFYRIHIELQ